MIILLTLLFVVSISVMAFLPKSRKIKNKENLLKSLSPTIMWASKKTLDSHVATFTNAIEALSKDLDASTLKTLNDRVNRLKEYSPQIIPFTVHDPKASLDKLIGTWEGFVVVKTAAQSLIDSLTDSIQFWEKNIKLVKDKDALFSTLEILLLRVDDDLNKITDKEKVGDFQKKLEDKRQLIENFKEKYDLEVKARTAPSIIYNQYLSVHSHIDILFCSSRVSLLNQQKKEKREHQIASTTDSSHAFPSYVSNSSAK